jgi:STE24 endopeptidase
MTFVRRFLFAFCFAILLAAVAPRLGSGPRASAQAVAAQSAPASAAAQPATQAYSLPPDKLAKAIALSRIRNILDIVGGLWAVAVLWLLLATRAAAGLEAGHSVFCTAAGCRAALLRRPSGHHDPGQPAPGYLQPARQPQLRHQRAGLGQLAGRPGQVAGPHPADGRARAAALQLDRRRWPRRYWLGAWVVTLPLLVLTIFVSPLLDPIFNKFEPLAKDHSALVAELEQVVARTGTNIPPGRMFLMKASLKTNGLNAYVTGLGATKRIVVWDTTAGRIPDDEVLFIFGHESGHYVLNHIPKMIAGIAAALFFVYWACAGFAAWLARRFGPRWGLNDTAALSTRAGFVVLLFTVSVASFVLEPASNTFSRHFEHQADVYGQEAIHGIVADPQKTAVASFNALGEAWLEDPNPSPFIEFWELQPPQRPNPRQLRPALRPLGQWRPRPVLSEIGGRPGHRKCRLRFC